MPSSPPPIHTLAVPTLFGVSGLHVLVTGGGRGLGLMIAAGFVANGAHVIIASRDKAACQQAAEALHSQGLTPNPPHTRTRICVQRSLTWM